MAFYDTAQLSKLQTASKEEDWFTAIVLSATQIERHGYIVMKEYLESLNADSLLVNRLLDRTRLYQIASYLLAANKIDQSEYSTIKEINEVRNKFIHRREKEGFRRGSEAKEKYEPLVNEAIRILKEKLNAVRLFVSR